MTNDFTRKIFDDLATGQFFMPQTNPLGAILFQKTGEDGYRYWTKEEGEGMSDDTFHDLFKSCEVVRRPDWVPTDELDHKFWSKEEIPEKGIYELDNNEYIQVLGIVDNYSSWNDDDEYLLIQIYPEGDHKLINHSSWVSYFQQYLKSVKYWGRPNF